jgi:outer membrane protein assembly factor BamE (lipoprotein component of BamABCDE complex)
LSYFILINDCTSKKNQGNDSHYGLSCAKPDMQESEVNFLIDKEIKLLNVSFDEQKIIQKKTKYQSKCDDWFAERKRRKPETQQKL